MGMFSPLARRLVGGLAFCACLSSVQALELVVEGRALVREGDLPQARELAMRRALASAAESRAATVSTRSIAHLDAVLETAQISASACTRAAQVVNESVTNDEIVLTVSVTVLDAGDCQASCTSSYINKIVVAGFPLEFPGQLISGEGHLPYLTSVELARKLGGRGRLLVDHYGAAFPFSSPAKAPEPYLRTGDTETLFSVLARKHRGQYVLAGIYRDFGLRKKRSAATPVAAYRN
jgi:hypothetical protein